MGDFSLRSKRRWLSGCEDFQYYTLNFLKHHYFLITVSAARVGVSMGIVEVSAGETVDGSLVVSLFGSSVPPLSLQAMIIPATAKMASNFFICIAFGFMCWAKGRGFKIMSESNA